MIRDTDSSVFFQSAGSGSYHMFWKAAGDISCVVVNGQKFYPTKEQAPPADKVTKMTSEVEQIKVAITKISNELNNKADKYEIKSINAQLNSLEDYTSSSVSSFTDMVNKLHDLTITLISDINTLFQRWSDNQQEVEDKKIG